MAPFLCFVSIIKFCWDYLATHFDYNSYILLNYNTIYFVGWVQTFWRNTLFPSVGFVISVLKVGSTTYFRNVGTCLPYYTVLHSITQRFESSLYTLWICVDIVTEEALTVVTSLIETCFGSCVLCSLQVVDAISSSLSYNSII
jgi:hypothetical protein